MRWKICRFGTNSKNQAWWDFGIVCQIRLEISNYVYHNWAEPTQNFLKKVFEQWYRN